MGIVSCIYCITIALIWYFLERRWYCPGVVLSAGFGILSFLSYLQLYEVYAVSDFGYRLVMIFITAFTVGGLIIKLIYRANIGFFISKRKIGSLYVFDKEFNYEPRRRTVNIFFVFALAYFAVKAYQALTLLLGGASMTYIRDSFVGGSTDSEMVGSGAEALFIFYIARPAMFFAISYGICDFLDSEGKSKKYLYLVAVIIILNLLTSGGRTLVAFSAVLFIIAYSIFSKEKRYTFSFRKYRREMKKWILIVFVFMVVLVVTMTLIRTENKDTYNLGRRMYIYTGCIIPYMDKQVTDYNYGNLNGLAFWLGVIRIPRAILMRLFFMEPSEEYMILTQTIPYIKHLGKLVSPTINMNGFVTAIFYFYADFGVPGVIFETVLYAFMCFPFYEVVKKRPNRVTIARFMLIMYSVFTAMLENPMSYNIVASILIYCFVFKKKEENKSELKPSGAK